MAVRQIYRLNPQDIGQPRGIGVSVLYNNSTNVFNSTITTKEQVKSNLINYVLTNKGERLYDPNFGGDIRRAIFEANDDAAFESVIARLEDEILAYVPNIILQSITLQKNPDYNMVTISINYQLNQENQNIVLNVETNGLNNLV
jgi:phage baseplate assembly protein W